MPTIMPSVLLKILLPEITLPKAAQSIRVSGLSLDSRKVLPGDLFFAVGGGRYNGADFIADAFRAGAIVVLCESSSENIVIERADGWTIAIHNLAQKVSEIAARFYGLPGQELHTIGITGTNGKTTCSQLLARLYYALGERSAVMGTLGYGSIGGVMTDTGMTTPDAVQVQKILRDLRIQHVRHLAIEVSSHALVQSRVAALPMQTVIFTNLSRDHLDFHHTMQAYGAAKLSLFQHLGVMRGVINLDDDFSATIQAQGFSIPLTTYSVHRTDADVYAADVEYHDSGVRAQIVTPWGNGELRARLMGEFNLSNLLAVIAAACVEGFGLSEVLAAVATLVPIPGRMQRVEIEADIQVIVDYAHTPDALRAVLSAARSHCRGKLICVFGCGGDRDKGKRSEMAKISASLADLSVVTSDNPRTENPVQIINDILTGFDSTHSVRVEVDRKLAISKAVADAESGDLLVIAGKGHEDYQIIGVEKFPFNDLEEASSAIKLRLRGAI